MFPGLSSHVCLDSDSDGLDHTNAVEFTSLRALFLPVLWPWGWMMMVRCLAITVLPMYVLDIGLSYEDVGLFTAVNRHWDSGGNIPAGSINSRCGPRLGNILEGLIYCAAALLLCVPLPLDRKSWVTAAACGSLLAGFAETLGILSRQTMLGAAVPAAMRGRAGSAMGGMWRAGSMLGPLLGGLVAHAAGPRVAFLLQAGFALLHVLWSFLFIPTVSASQDINRSSTSPSGNGAKKEDAEESTLSVARQHWKTLLRYSTGHARHMSQAEVGKVASLSFLVDAVCFPIAGLLMDSAGRIVAANLSLACGAIALFVVTQESLHLAVFAIMAGLANAISAGLTLTVGADIAPAHCRAKFLALYRTVGKSSDFIAPLALGVLAHRASMRAANLVAAGFCVFGVAWGLCCVKETLQRDPAIVAPLGPCVSCKYSKLGDGYEEEEEGEEEENENMGFLSDGSPINGNERATDSSILKGRLADG
eukprot:CAMPEP_0179180106 /NCGR_PEP_ID=MMETSP0796-20121207/89149_1 /TAXON_ID=73915 /ORGANISM="Pyrodinium bahamense, Strain pbaha01" /LENGTH=476 /DNA_ID=CAMNT_0020883787 /DNA_START=71 /DNA_END=1504 /DNA_ORIENTATION=-